MSSRLFKAITTQLATHVLQTLLYVEILFSALTLKRLTVNECAMGRTELIMKGACVSYSIQVLEINRFAEGCRCHWPTNGGVCFVAWPQLSMFSFVLTAAGAIQPDLALSCPLAYYSVVEGMQRLCFLESTDSWGAALWEGLDWMLFLPDLLADQGKPGHKLLASKQHYSSYMSAFASFSKAVQKTLAWEVDRVNAARAVGERGDDSRIKEVVLSLKAAGGWLMMEFDSQVQYDPEESFWVGFDGDSVDQGLGRSTATASLDLTLVLWVARTVGQARKLLGTLQPAPDSASSSSSSSRGTGSSRGVPEGTRSATVEVGSSSSSSRGHGSGFHGLPHVSLPVLDHLTTAAWSVARCLALWQKTPGTPGSCLGLEAGGAGDVGAVADAATGSSSSGSSSWGGGGHSAALASAPPEIFSSSSPSSSSSSFPVSGSGRSSSSPSSAASSGRCKASGSAQAPSRSDAAPSIAIPRHKRLGKLPQAGLPNAVIEQLDLVWPKWAVRCKVSQVPEQQQQEYWTDMLKLSEVLLQEVPIVLGCSNPTCTDMKGVSEAAESNKKCTGCRMCYCSRECQVAHWKAGHKDLCSKLQQQTKEEEQKKKKREQK